MGELHRSSGFCNTKYTPPPIGMPLLTLDRLELQLYFITNKSYYDKSWEENAGWQREILDGKDLTIMSAGKQEVAIAEESGSNLGFFHRSL